MKGKVQHQFADTGTYTVKLTVILAGQCIDSTIKVYRFYPGFEVIGTCSPHPVQDTAKT